MVIVRCRHAVVLGVISGAEEIYPAVAFMVQFDILKYASAAAVVKGRD